MTWVLLVELTGYTDAATAVVHRYSTGRYSTQPTDTPANAWFDERVTDPGSITRTVPTERNNPRAEVGYGVIRLANIDGALDATFGGGAVSFRERQARVLRVREGAAYSTAEVLLVATIAQVELSETEVTISVKDPSYRLASAHLTDTYGGTNALPAGVDGVDDLRGKVKPALYGKALKIAPPQVNTSRLIYQISTRALQSVDGVYDGGAPYSAGAAYSSEADMQANAPSAGQYRAWLAGGMIRLGTAPSLGLTVDATADSAGNSTPGRLLERLALDRGFTAPEINASDITALNTASSAVCGVWISDSRTTLDAMDLIARSCGAVYWFDRLGVLRMRQLSLPGAAEAVAVAPWSAQRVTQVMSGQDVPTETVRIRYARYGATQGPSQVAGTVTQADRADLAQEWRVAEYSAAPSPNPHFRLLTTERDTALTTKAAADAEALRLHGLTAAPRRTHKAEGVQLSDSLLLSLDLMAVVELRWRRYGFDPVVGSPRRVMSLTTYLRDLRADLTLWGP
jgi:hypothetical protein